MNDVILDFVITAETPLTVGMVSEKTGMDQKIVEEQLEKLVKENQLHKREFFLEKGIIRPVYWTSNVIPFSYQDPIVTSPFSQPFNYKDTNIRLTDAQLEQEKVWLQQHLRKVSSELENLKHLSAMKITEEEENKLDELKKKWINVSQELLEALLKKIRFNNPNVTMNQLLQQNKIDPELVRWNSEDEEFNPL